MDDRLKLRCSECRTPLDLSTSEARLVQDPQGEWTGLEYDCPVCVDRILSSLHPEMGRHLQQRGVPGQLTALPSVPGSGEPLDLDDVDALVALLERPAEEIFAELAGATTLRPRWARWLR